MSRKTSLEERLQMVTLSEEGQTARAIAEKTGWSRSTVRKWLRRYKDQSRSGLVTKMGRPKQGALSSYPKKTTEIIRAIRQAHPGWGAITLSIELQGQAEIKRVPSAASIGRYLKEQGLSRRYKRHTKLPDTEILQTITEPHQLWMMDARGHSKVPEIGLIALINISDCATRVRALSYPVLAGKKRLSHTPDTVDHQTALRLAFMDWGLPKRIQVDRATIFYDNVTKSPFPTRLHLWLIALGVDLSFSRPRMPTDQAISERSHQLWAKQCLEGQTFSSWQHLFEALNDRRRFLNQRMPCVSINNQPPLIAFPGATHSGRPYRPEYEHEILDLSRVWQYLAKGQYFRRISSAGTFTIGGQQYYLDYTLAGQQIELSFDPDLVAFSCHNEASEWLAHIPISGISVNDLMGDFHPHLPVYQLHLPFDWNSFQVLRLFETIVS